MSSQIKNFEQYHQVYKQSVEDPESFWAAQAENFKWRKKWDKVLEWDFHDYDVKWFPGAKFNITENCLDRHLKKRGNQTAIIWEPNDPNDPTVRLTFRQLHEEVCRFANVLRKNGVKKGDRVCLYMPMIPELAIAVLATARLGAVHSVVFGGFSAQSLADRINDSECKVVVTTDGSFRGSKEIGLKVIVDEAIQNNKTVKKVIVFKRTGQYCPMTPKRDLWWHEETAKVSAVCKAVEVDAEDMLFILYTSGSTGKPKGVVHTCGGYMVFADYSFRNVFQVKDNDIYWCTADIGWITGHSYIVYAPLLVGCTSIIFEGIPTWPDSGRFWEVVDKHSVSVLYTAPTAIRSLMSFGLDPIARHSLGTLRVLGSVGEPINEEAWRWYHKYIGKSKCPIVDTWWQTETGGILISPIANVTPLKPAHATLPLPGVQPVLLTAEGKEIEGNDVEGLLCLKFPWPSMIRTTYGDHNRCKEVYFKPFPGYYFTGDGARRDEDGYYRIIGRVDDVINVSGHRIGTAEVENAINQHSFVLESAVVGYPHDIKGQGIYAFVITDRKIESQKAFRDEVMITVTKEIGPIAKPDKILVVSGLPKTRSGKIMRRILRKIASGETDGGFGDTTTLLNPEIIEEIMEGASAIK